MGTYGRKAILALALIITASAAYAQKGWKWPADTAAAKEKYVLLSDNVKAKRYADALEPFTWLHDNAPDLHKALYINGAKVFKGLAKVEKDKTKKAEFTAELIKVYEERIQRFGQEDKVIPYIAFTSYRAWAKDSTKYDYILNACNKTLDVLGDKTNPFVAQGVIHMMYQKKRAGQEIPEEQVLEAFDKVSNVLAAQKEAGKNVASTENTVNKLLNGLVKINCELIQEKFVPKMREGEGEAQLKAAQYVFKLSTQAECISEPYFLESLIVLNKHTPSAGLAKSIAKKLLSAKKFDEAAPYLDQALGMETDAAKKAELFLLKAKSNASVSKVTARQLAFEAIKTDASVAKDAYTLVGNLYLQSYQSCKKGQSRVKDRAVFLAAFEMFQKAGNKKYMAMAKAQFPSSEEIFAENFNEGDKIQVGCWINTTATLRRR